MRTEYELIKWSDISWDKRKGFQLVISLTKGRWALVSLSRKDVRKLKSATAAIVTLCDWYCG